MKKILAVASHGGHWIQLQRLYPIFNKHQTYFITTAPKSETQPRNTFSVIDANFQSKIRLVIQALQVTAIIIRLRPQVVISTGASVGFFAIAISKIFCSKTVWIDSLANTEKLSISGRYVKPFTDMHLTQWPDLKTGIKPDFKGTVI